jgi:DNA-binding SARP family transcriptional activator
LSEARSTLRHGLLALAKSALLVAGVPASLLRLWYLTPTPPSFVGRSVLASPASWVHILILVAAVLWGWAAVNLVREVLAAVRHASVTSTSSWSARWAGGIAGLVLLMTAGSAAATSAVTVGLQHRGGSVNIVAAARKTLAPTVYDQPLETVSTADVAAGEDLADLAARTTGRRAAWLEINEANLDAIQRDGRRFVDANLVRPGWRLTVPELSVETALDPARSDYPAAQSASGSNHHGLDEASLFGLGIVATAALARRMRTLRRLGESTRRTNERVAPFPPDLGWVDALTAPLATSTLLEWIDAALRLVTMAAGTALEGERPNIELVRAGPDGVEFLLSQPRRFAPAPFVADASGSWWQLDRSLTLAEACEIGREFGRFVPWLVPVGDDGEAVYLVALGPGRRLVVAGDRPSVRAALAGLRAALRVLPWAEELEVELIGLAAPPPDERCYQLVDSSAATLEELSRVPRAGERTTVRPLWRREPLVLIGVGTELECDEDVLTRVQSVSGVIAPRGEGTVRLVLDGGSARLEPFGIALVASVPSNGQLDLLERLLAAASAGAELVPLAPELARRERDLEQGEHDRADLLPRGLVEIQLLATPPSVSGLTRPPAARDLDRVIELLAYLALHGHRASSTDVAMSMFAREDAAGRALRLANVVAAARGALPARADGARALSPLADPELRLDQLVSSDWARFRDAAERARVASPARAVALLRAAFELVPSEPNVATRRTYDWMTAEGLRVTIGAEIVDAAHHLAALALAANDLGLARWAIAKGRSVEPTSEMLVRDLLVALDASGDIDGLRAVFRDLEQALTDLGGSEPSPETRALFEHLTTKHP